MKRKVLLLLAVCSLLSLIIETLAFGQEVFERPVARFGKGIIKDIVFSPDGKLLAVGSTLGIWLYTFPELAEIGLLEFDMLSAIAFSPNGKFIASGTYSGIALWDVELRKKIISKNISSDWIVSLVFSPDGKILAIGTGEEKILLWDLDQDKVITLEEHSSAGQLAFSPDGELLASISKEAWQEESKEVWLWELASRKKIAALKGHVEEVETIAFSPDGRLLASGGFWDKTIRFWGVLSQQEVVVLNLAVEGFNALTTDIEFSTDGSLLVFGTSDGRIHLWDVSLQQPRNRQNLRRQENEEVRKQ